MAIYNGYRWYEDENNKRTKVHIDDALCAFDNFIGYQGEPPTTATQFKNLKAIGGTKTKTVWKESTTAPTWTEVQTKQTELTTAAQKQLDDKLSAYRKLSMTDDEIRAIDPTLLEE